MSEIKSRLGAYINGEVNTLNYVGNFNTDLLRTELLDAFPFLRVENKNIAIEYFGMSYSGSNLALSFRLSVDNAIVDSIIKLHDATAAKPIDWDMIVAAKNAFMSLPNYATWTPEEAQAWIDNDIFGGQTQAQIATYVDANMANITQARAIVKLLTQEILDLKEIVKKEAYMLVLLRNIVVKRSLL
jgi:hypothetical protein